VSIVVRRWLAAIVLALATLAATACAGARIADGVFHSSKGYRVALPGNGWTVANDRADLELTHRDGSAGMLVNASCGRDRSSAPLAVLARHLLTGLRDRSVVMREDVTMNGSVARHSIVEARDRETGAPVKVELYVMRDERCLYDFLYVAPTDSFDAWQRDFERFVRTFSTDTLPSARRAGEK
jgi:hypothetical protein